MDTMDLRVELLSKQGGELAAQQEASLLAAQYAAGAVIGALDTAVRVEVAFQQEMTRWIRGIPPSTRVERIAEASGASNGRHQVPAIESVQAEAREVVSPPPVVQGQEFATREEAAAAIEAKIAADTNGAPTPS
jgi:hypothetical protein